MKETAVVKTQPMVRKLRFVGHINHQDVECFVFVHYEKSNCRVVTSNCGKSLVFLVNNAIVHEKTKQSLDKALLGTR